MRLGLGLGFINIKMGLLAVLMLSGCEYHKWMFETLTGTGDEEEDTGIETDCLGDYLIKNESDMEAISHCESISGYLGIYESNLTNLDGLSNLTTVGEGVYISSNESLTNLDGLSNLTSVGGYLNIYDNGSLTNLDGLSNLTTIGDYLRIEHNESLTNLDGLSNLTSVGGSLNIYDNDSLCQSLVDALFALFPNNDTIGGSNSAC